MDFVDRHRPLEPRPERRPLRHPLAVAPLVVDGRHDRRRQRRHFECDAERIDLDGDLAGPRPQLELVAMAAPRRRREDLPHAAGAERAHRVHAPVPVVEVADDADAGRVRGPDREVNAFDAADRHRMRAELVVDAGVIAFAEEIEIVVGEHPAEAVGVVDLGGVPAGIVDPQAVVRHGADARHHQPRRCRRGACAPWRAAARGRARG